MNRIITFTFVLLFSSLLEAQNCASLDFQLESEIPSLCTGNAMTMLHDQQGKDYLYIANKEAGLNIYSILDINSPSFVINIPISDFSDLHVMNLSQDGNYLYLALGNHFVSGQEGGIAVVNVSNPESPVLEDYHVMPSTSSGCGIIKIEGDIAYVGAMKSGIVLMDVSDKSNITQIAQFVPDINYPVNSPNPDLYNARGMEVKNKIVYLTYDAGGFRIIDCSDTDNISEIGRYSNPVLHDPFNLPRAYNNIIIDGSLAYIAVDYCGLEVLDFSDVSNIKLHGWWNPGGCPDNNWFTAASHANELAINKSCNQLFVSTGKSDLIVLDISDPSSPTECNSYGGVSNDIGTWGVSSYANQLYLSYICAIVPFSSNWTGVKILTYTPCINGIDEERNNSISVFPNPTEGEVVIESENEIINTITLVNLSGKVIISQELNNTSSTLNIEYLPKGIYLLNVSTSTRSYYQKLILK